MEHYGGKMREKLQKIKCLSRGMNGCKEEEKSEERLP